MGEASGFLHIQDILFSLQQCFTSTVHGGGWCGGHSVRVEVRLFTEGEYCRNLLLNRENLYLSSSLEEGRRRTKAEQSHVGFRETLCAFWVGDEDDDDVLRR